MEKANVIALLEKYWQTETTVAEEQALAAYFQGDQVDAELTAYGGLFSYFQEEAQVSAGADFGNRILQRLGLPLDEALVPGAAHGAPDEVSGQDRASGPDVAYAAAEAASHEVPVVPIAREPFRFGIAAAAAAILLIVAGLFLLSPPRQSRMLAETQAARATQARSTDHAEVTDTYDDPEKALAAVRHALLIASKNLNQGCREITRAHK